MNRRSGPHPLKKKNVSGFVLRRFRLDAELSQSELALQLQLNGWDLDRSVVARIESGQRTILDFELGFILKVLGRSWSDFAVSVE